MAGAGAAIREGSAGDRDELPVVAGRAEGELQHSVRVAIAHFAVGDRNGDGIMTLTAGTCDELANAGRRVERAEWRLRREPLVIVIMPVQDHVSAGVIEGLPECLIGRAASVLAGAVSRLMPVGERAGGGM